MVSTHTLFEWLVGLHIATGAIGLIVVWIPIAGKKGGALHRRAGTLFVQSMIATGFTAIAIRHLIGRFSGRCEWTGTAQEKCEKAQMVY